MWAPHPIDPPEDIFILILFLCCEYAFQKHPPLSFFLLHLTSTTLGGQHHIIVFGHQARSPRQTLLENMYFLSSLP